MFIVCERMHSKLCSTTRRANQGARRFYQFKGVFPPKLRALRATHHRVALFLSGGVTLKKIPTLFLRDPNDMSCVTTDINPDAAWLLETMAIPTVKKDGTNILVVVQDGSLIEVHKRRNPTREEKARGQEPDYTATDRDNSQDKHIFASVDATNFATWPDGAWSCEALGPKIQGGVESNVPALYPFSWAPEVIETGIAISYGTIKAYLEKHEIEGIVWHEQTGEKRMAKAKRKDFGLCWPVKRSK